MPHHLKFAEEVRVEKQRERKQDRGEKRQREIRKNKAKGEDKMAKDQANPRCFARATGRTTPRFLMNSRFLTSYSAYFIGQFLSRTFS